MHGGILRDQHNFNQPGWQTLGDNSPMAGRDVNITYAQTGDGQRVPVELRNEKASWVTSTKAQIIAFVSTVLSFAITLWTVFGPSINWGLWLQISSISGFVDTITATLSAGLPYFIAILVCMAISIVAWRNYRARKRNFPSYPGRFSLRRALIPSSSRPGTFTRTRVYAECPECRADNRPGIFARLFSYDRNAAGEVRYKCRNGHIGQFRGRSVFSD